MSPMPSTPATKDAQAAKEKVKALDLAVQQIVTVGRGPRIRTVGEGLRRTDGIAAPVVALIDSRAIPGPMLAATLVLSVLLARRDHASLAPHPRLHRQS